MRTFDLLCLTPSLWGDRVRRLHHLMRVAARTHRVVVVEQAANITEDAPLLACPVGSGDGVRVFRPADRYWNSGSGRVRTSLRAILGSAERERLAMWVDSPRVLSLVPVARQVTLVCDLANPVGIGAKVLSRADLMLAGGAAGYEASRHLHPRAHLVPHGVDPEHFAPARTGLPEPADQAGIPFPRVGFWGTINDGIDFGLLDAVAARLPELHFVMIGGIERLGRERASSRRNIHWLGSRPYVDLPAYIAGWDAAVLPFARNEATRFLSPPQIAEFLAAGRGVVSTTLRDVQHHWGASGLLRMADTPDSFAAAIEAARRDRTGAWLSTVDRYLEALSWRSTWAGIEHLINGVMAHKGATAPIERRVRRATTMETVSVLH